MDGWREVFENIVDQVKESQLKLGYAPEAVRLYYLAPSLARIYGWAGAPDDAAGLARALSDDARLHSTLLGRVEFEAAAGGRVCAKVPPEGVRRVHEDVLAPAFLQDIVELFAPGSHPARADIEALFARYGAYSVREMAPGDGFDYMVRFDDRSIDRYCYCFKSEMGHTIYHRFSEADYSLRWPEDASRAEA